MTATNKESKRTERGFTIPEVIVAAVLLTIICVGTIQTFVFATRINRGNNLRMQALSVLQQEVEFYRSLKFVPGQETVADLPNHRSNWIYGGTHTRPQRTSADGRVFNLTVDVTNLSPSTTEELVRYKRITITATPAVAENEGWLSDASLNTKVTVERVRSNSEDDWRDSKQRSRFLDGRVDHFARPYVDRAGRSGRGLYQCTQDART